MVELNSLMWYFPKLYSFIKYKTYKLHFLFLCYIFMLLE